VFLNIISLEVTPFNLTTAIVFSILIGGAIADIIKRIEYQASVRRRVKQFGKFSFLAAPLLLLSSTSASATKAAITLPTNRR